MKKFEYKPFSIRGLIAEKIAKNKTLGDYQAYELVLNEIGLDGWELFSIGNDVIGKREIQEKKGK